MKVPFYGLKSCNKNQIILSEIESRHCIKVLRYKIGDKVQVIDGKGSMYECVILDDNLQNCTLDIINTDFKELPNHSLHIAIAPPKNPDRIDWLIEKSVEIGVSKVSFVISNRSIRNKIKLERLERIAIAAMKQSCSRYKLIIDEIVPLSDVLSQISAKQRLILHLEKGKRVLLNHVLEPKKDTCILIGPEGDFTLEEIDMAIGWNFKPTSLGGQRLRTETAAIMVASAFSYINEY